MKRKTKEYLIIFAFLSVPISYTLLIFVYMKLSMNDFKFNILMACMIIITFIYTLITV